MSPAHGDGGPADWLAAVAAGDSRALGEVSRRAAGNIEDSGLDMRTHALVRLAARLAAGEPGACCEAEVGTALDHGVTPVEVAGVLVTLAPTVGATRLTAAARAVLDAIDRANAGVPAVAHQEQA